MNFGTPKIDLKSQSQILWPAIIIGILIVASLFILTPKLKQAWELKKEIRQDREQLAVLEAKLRTLENLTLTELKENREIALTALPAESDVPYFLTAIELYALKHDLVLQNFSLKEEKFPTDEDEAEDGYLVISCDLAGLPENLSSFFDETDQLLPLIEINQIKVIAQDELFEASILVKFFNFGIEEKSTLPEKLALLSQDEEDLLVQLGQYWRPPRELVKPPAPSSSSRDNPFF